MEEIWIPEQKTPHFYMPPHKLTTKTDITYLKKTLSQEDLNLFTCLYEQAQKNPRKANAEIGRLHARYPKHPAILNLFSYVLLSLKKPKKAEKLIVKNYLYNPDNLLAKINYGDFCLRKKRSHQIPIIFDQKYQLRALYPSRQTFHIVEFRSFMTLMGWYFSAIKQKDIALCYHYLAKRIDPSHPQVNLLGKKLYALPWYKRFIGYQKPC